MDPADLRERKRQRMLALRARYALRAMAPNTRRAYRSDWDDFAVWCRAQGVSALPAEPETVALYLADVSDGLRPATLRRRLVTIRRQHLEARLETPTASLVVHETMRGIRRAHGIRPIRKQPILTSLLRELLLHLPRTITGLRDRALLLIGFASALRRSELVSIDYDNLEFQRDGLIITLGRSKTDQEGASRRIGIPYGQHMETCPVRALQAWLRAASIRSGPVFRPISKAGAVAARRLSDKSVALIVKRSVALAGYDPAQFAGHSLRAGLATQAALSGASERAIMKQTGHRSVEMVRQYIREGELFRDNAAGYTGL